MVYVSDSEHWLQELQFHHRAKLANGNYVSGMRTIASNAAFLLRFLTMCSRGDKLGYWRSIIIFCGRKLPKIIYSADLNWQYDFDAENKRHLVFPVLNGNHQKCMNLKLFNPRYCCIYDSYCYIWRQNHMLVQMLVGTDVIWPMLGDPCDRQERSLPARQSFTTQNRLLFLCVWPQPRNLLNLPASCGIFFLSLTLSLLLPLLFISISL